MQIRRYLHPQEFLKECLPILERQEEQNSLMIGLVDGLCQDWENKQGLALLYSFAEVDVHQHGPAHYHAIPKESCFFAVRTDARRGWIISATDGMKAENLFGVMACLRGMHPEVKQLTGPRELTTAFAGMYGADCPVNFMQLLYRCEAVTAPAHIAAGHLRVATAGDVPVLGPWVKAFMRESLGEELSDEMAGAQAQSRVDSGRMLLWDDGGPVSMLQILRPTRHGCSIGFVYTPDAERKKGYASMAVAEATRRELGAGGRKFVVLFTNEKHLTSNHIYGSVGYVEIAKFARYDLKVDV